jgi:GT2 family glycosyltransferase
MPKLLSMDVSFIIVNYNTTELTRACIKSIFSHTKDLDFEVWLVDSASNDGSVRSVKDEFPRVQLLELSDNKGFGAANNEAILKANGEFIFLLNPDTELQSDAATTFVQFMRASENTKVAVCGGHLFTGAEKKTPSYGNFPSLLQSISSFGLCYLYPGYYREKLDTGVVNTQMQVRPVDFVSGADMFIRKKIVDQCGAFDPDFFLYFEETELCKRIRRAGYGIVLIPIVRILHHEAGSTGKQKFNAFSFYHFERSKRLYYKKVYGTWYMWMATPFNMIGIIMHSLFGKQKGNLVRKVNLFLGIRSYIND